MLNNYGNDDNNHANKYSNKTTVNEYEGTDDDDVAGEK